MKLQVFSRVVSGLCFVFLSLNLQAQVTLIDATSNQPVVGAEVFAELENKIYKSDKKGQLFLSKNAKLEDSIAITIYSEGYATLNTFIATTSQSIISLKKLNVNLASVTVTDKEKENNSFGLQRLRNVEGTAVYAGKKTETTRPRLLTINKAANVSRQVFAQISGLNIFEGSTNGLQLNIGGRGLDPNRSASFNVRQNGYDISADVLGYPESYYTPPADAIERVEVIRGAASLQYGTQFGGLVNFKTVRPPRDSALIYEGAVAAGSFGLASTFQRVGGSKGSWSYQVYYLGKRGNDFRPNSDFTSHNAHTFLQYRFRENTKLTAEITYLKYLAQQPGGLTDAQFEKDPYQSNRTRNFFEVNWLLGSVLLEHRFSPNTNASINLFGLRAGRDAVGFRTNRVSQTDDLDAPRDLLSGRFRNGGAEARILHRWSLNGNRAISLAGIKLYAAQNTSTQGPGSTSTDADFQLQSQAFPDYPSQSDFTYPNRNLALFGEQIFFFGDYLSLTPGLRYEYIKTETRGEFRRVDFDLAGNPIRNELLRDDRTFERALLLGGLGLAYRPSTKFELYANVSQNYRSVTFTDIRTVNPSFVVDPNITDERGFTADVGVRGDLPSISYEATFFALRYAQRLGEVLTEEMRDGPNGVPRPTGRVVRLRSNIGTALITGLETNLEAAILQKPSQRLTAFSNLTLHQSEYIESQLPGVANNQVEFIPNVLWRSGLRHRWKNLKSSLQFSYVSQQFTDASNAPRDIRDNQSGIVGAIPSYTILDLSASYTISKRWQLEASINNLLDRAYFTRRATGYPGPGIIPSAPRFWTVGVRFGG